MGTFCTRRTLSDNQIYSKNVGDLKNVGDQRRPSTKYDYQRTLSNRSRSYNKVDLVLLSELMERVVNTFDAERRTSEQLYYETYHGKKDDCLRIPLEKQYFRERAKSVTILKNSLNFVVKP